MPQPDNVTCWGRATHCQTDQLVGNQSLCEAWYRCDGVSNYVIQWRCQGKASSFNPTLRKCDNSSKGLDTELCPPPVVCPSTMREDRGILVTKDDVIDVDIVLAVVLAAFALITLVLLLLASCKFWLARKRFQRRFHPKYRHFRAFSTTSKYPGLWTVGGSPKHMKKFMGKSGTVKGIPYTDVYIPYPNQHTTYLHRLVDESGKNNYWSFQRSKKRSKVKRAGKVFGDRSVLTGSFVYQPTVLQYDARGSNVDQDLNYSTNRRDVYYSKTGPRQWNNNFRMRDPKSPRTNNNISTTSLFRREYEDSEFYFKGNNREKSTQPVHYMVQPPSIDDSRENYKPFTGPQISSIHIPSYDNNIDDNSLHIPYTGRRGRFDHKHGGVFRHPHLNRHFQNDSSPENDWSDSWRSSTTASPFAMGRVHRKGVSESASVASKNWRYTVFSQQHNVHSGTEERITKTDLEPSMNSPDVISSHNLSHHVTHIAQDTHVGDDAQLGQDHLIARISVPGNQTHHDNGDVSNKNGDTHPTKDKESMEGQISNSDTCSSSSSSSSSATPLNQELSYDSFRNEHLRQLAKHGAVASSSTLDKGMGQIRANNFRVKQYRH